MTDSDVNQIFVVDNCTEEITKRDEQQTIYCLKRQMEFKKAKQKKRNETKQNENMSSNCNQNANSSMNKIQ